VRQQGWGICTAKQCCFCLWGNRRDSP
jgi:hypothetical protein